MYYAKQNKSFRERQIPYNFTHMWNFISKTDEHKGKKKKKKKKGRQSIKRRLTIENKLRVARGEVGGGWAEWMMGIKVGTCCDEHRVFYVSKFYS